MVRTKGMGGHSRPHHGKTNDWLTPPAILESLGSFDIDPCCPPGMPWRTAATMLTTRGLEAKWTGRAFVNPPYGPDTGRWLARLAEHGRGTALIFARTETEHWFEHVWPKATAILFLEGRLHFHVHQDTVFKVGKRLIDVPAGGRAPFNSGAPSALVAYGLDDARRLRLADITGQFIALRGGDA